MRRRRTIYHNDARHSYLWHFEPPMRLEDAWIPIDEVAGTAVDTFSYCVERGDAAHLPDQRRIRGPVQHRPERTLAGRRDVPPRVEAGRRLSLHQPAEPLAGVRSRRLRAPQGREFLGGVAGEPAGRSDRKRHHPRGRGGGALQPVSGGAGRRVIQKMSTRSVPFNTGSRRRWRRGPSAPARTPTRGSARRERRCSPGPCRRLPQGCPGATRSGYPWSRS